LEFNYHAPYTPLWVGARQDFFLLLSSLRVLQHMAWMGEGGSRAHIILIKGLMREEH
jgi:hypothetical protein